MNSAQDTLAGGLPHSDIPGSPIARISPGLFAACHVLHRLSVPRHPPDALLLRLIPGVPGLEERRNAAAHRGKTRSPAAAGGRPRESGDPALGAALLRLSLGATSLRRCKAASHEDTSRTHPARLRRACPPRSHDKLPLHPSINTPPQGKPGPVSRHASPNVAPPPAHHRRGRGCPMVEVNGIEPMTSCLQSRRSPN
jgi:hypothetical protein